MPLSPMMQRYMQMKERYKDCLVFYRLGDFYEMFFDDAKLVSKELQLTLTGRDCGLSERAPMCGVPYHSVNTYINKLLEKNYKVAICEQLTDPKLAHENKSLVERDVVRVVTPGTVIEDEMLTSNTNNFLAAVCFHKDKFGVAWADVSTGEFYISTVPASMELSELTDKLLEINPNEILADGETNERAAAIPSHIKKHLRPFTGFDGFTQENQKVLFARFTEIDRRKYSLPLNAAAALWSYLCDTQKNDLAHMRAIVPIEESSYLSLDSAAVRNLEIFRSMSDRGVRGSLIWVLDKTQTPMGARKLHSYLERPLRDKAKIEERLDAVGEIKDNFALREDLRAALEEVCDIERICTRIAYGTVTPKETVFMRRSFKKIPTVKALLEGVNSPLLSACRDNMDSLEEITGLLESLIADEPNESVSDGGVIRSGYSKELDEYRDAIEHGQEWILRLEAQEREATGIKNLRIKYNKVFGYLIEISNSFKDKVPLYYTRRQTLTGGERYTTEELTQTERIISGSEANAIRLETEIFAFLKSKLTENLFKIKQTAEALAVVDFLCSLALTADEYSFVRPSINTEGRISILDGRHPVIEAIQKNNSFVPNDTTLDNGDNRFMVITGPNMAGKSTYMRQVALITLLAHLGSFVPAREADISICDKIFTRVGASDDLSAGQSTFMLEMTEVAGIIKNATKDSLIILDEIGRGTSTFDGLSIAWAVTEYIADKKNIGAKTLFATHYHELSELEGQLDGIKNYCITAKEYGDDVIFLRKIMRGSADKSFGIAVAHLAGIPKAVLKRAKDILSDLEKADITNGGAQPASTQTMMFASDNLQSIVDELKSVDINTLTPLQAMNILCELRERAKREQ